MRESQLTLAAVVAGGAAGTLARAIVEQACEHDSTAFPWPTLAVNGIGAVLLGAVVASLHDSLPPMGFRHPLIATGLCGGLTTFSTLQIELLNLLSAGRVGIACAYAGASVAAGLIGVALASTTVRRLRLAR